MNPNFSIIILTLNEEQHLPRLLHSIAGLNAETYVFDSGSTDQTIPICEASQVKYMIHAFENHPKQWDEALKRFDIKTPWVIGLDADQQVCPILYQQLKTFKNDDYLEIDGIYFNRKNIFKGKWIKHGGYYPKYMLKMFRYDKGFSDLNENLDHHFIVPGKTIIWKEGALIEENLKENEISFWLTKHIRYSELLATEEIERMQHSRKQLVKPSYWGTPDQRIAWKKKLWWQLPLYIRPFLHLGFRLFFQKGILDGRTGILYHFLQALWFRLIVDIRIEEKLKEDKEAGYWQNRQYRTLLIRFLFLFPIVFMILYGFNIVFIGLTNPGGFYIEVLDKYFNYIKLWRYLTIGGTAALLEFLNYTVVVNEYGLHIAGRSGFRLVYSCLGYGILSLFSAFVFTFPNRWKTKVLLFLLGCITFQALNIFRLVMISLYWKPSPIFLNQNIHEIFNYSMYLLIALLTYISLQYKKPHINKKSL